MRDQATVNKQQKTTTTTTTMARRIKKTFLVLAPVPAPLHLVYLSTLIGFGGVGRGQDSVGGKVTGGWFYVKIVSEAGSNSNAPID